MTFFITASLKVRNTTFYYGRLGSLSAFTRRKGVASGKVNYYLNQFKQGATIVPRNFYFVELTQETPPDYHDRTLTVRTAEEQRKMAKRPWKSCTIQGRINSNFLFRTAISKNLIPFGIIDPELVLLPLHIGENNALHLLDWRTLQKEADLDTAKWFREVEQFWETHRTEKNESITSVSYLNWQNKLTEQNLNLPYLVLYTSSAKDANATVVMREHLDFHFIVDHKAYWFGTHSLEEAHFVASFLNSRVPNMLIKDFQSRGLFGARDVHKKILEVPFPKFDPVNEDHQQLAALGRDASDQVDQYLQSIDLSEISSHKLGRLRLDVRGHVSTTLKSIDATIQRITDL